MFILSANYNFRDGFMTRFIRLLLIALMVMVGLILAGCGDGVTLVDKGNKTGVLHVGNGAEPKSLDPQIVTGLPGAHVVSALMEGLVSVNPKTLEPAPGVAKSWDISDDGLIYTFHLRDNAKWSNGDPVTADDFVYSYKRILSPALGAKYAYSLYALKNAKAYHLGEIKDFDKVGAKALDKRTLRLTLNAPTPYFLSLLNHHSWYPVHPPTIAKHGEIDQPGTAWTRPGEYVGNGPFILKDWELNRRIVVTKNPNYWDADNVALNKVCFYSIDKAQAEERAFRGGQLHITETLLPSKIEAYQKNNPKALSVSPYLGTYYYLFNATKPPFDNPKVRKALAMAIERDKIVRHVTKGGQKPAFSFTPPNTAGYTAEARLEENVAEAKKLLAEAGYPDGKGFPRASLMFNTSESHLKVAQAIQRMWKKNLNVDIELLNKEWKVFLESQNRKDYDISRAGWIGDYNDPNTFLDLWVTDGGNNRAGWSNKNYDALIGEAAKTSDPKTRMELFQKAERILMDEAPVMPIYVYSRVGLIRPEVKGWYPNILDIHPLKYVRLETEVK